MFSPTFTSLKPKNTPTTTILSPSTKMPSSTSSPASSSAAFSSFTNATTNFQTPTNTTRTGVCLSVSQTRSALRDIRKDVSDRRSHSQQVSINEISNLQDFLIGQSAQSSPSLSSHVILQPIWNRKCASLSNAQPPVPIQPTTNWCELNQRQLQTVFKAITNQNIDIKIIKYGIYWNYRRFLKILKNEKSYLDFLRIPDKQLKREVRLLMKNKTNHDLNPNYLCTILQAFLKPIHFLRSYQIIGFLGSGAFGLTLSVQNRQSQTQHAIKILFPRPNKNTSFFSGKQELEIGKNIAKYLHIAPEVQSHQQTSINHFPIEVIVQQKLDMGCEPYMVCIGQVQDVDLQQQLFESLLFGMTTVFVTLRFANLVHGDCHSNNVMLAYTNNMLMPKLIDFGFLGCGVTEEYVVNPLDSPGLITLKAKSHLDWWNMRIYDLMKFATHVVAPKIPQWQKDNLLIYFSYLAYHMFPGHPYFHKGFQLFSYIATREYGKRYGRLAKQFRRVGCQNIDWKQYNVTPDRYKQILKTSRLYFSKIRGLLFTTQLTQNNQPLFFSPPPPPKQNRRQSLKLSNQPTKTMVRTPTATQPMSHKKAKLNNTTQLMTPISQQTKTMILTPTVTQPITPYPTSLKKSNATTTTQFMTPTATNLIASPKPNEFRKRIQF